MKVFSNYKWTFFFFIVLFQVFGLPFCSSQNLFSRESGFKYITIYKPKDYGLHAQNWSILQGKRGIIVANQSGLLVFDGVSWRSIILPTPSVFSIATDNDETIYVGGRNEFGRLTPDEKGSLQYESFREYLKNDKQKKSFDVWDIHPTKEKVYFRTPGFLFRWDAKTKQIKTILSPYGSDPFGVSFMFGGKLFIRQDKVGLMQMVNDSLELVTGGKAFADKKIYIMVPYDNDSQKYLIGTHSNGLYIYDHDKKTVMSFQIDIDVDDYLKEKKIWHGIRLSSSSTSSTEPAGFALATRFGGLVIIDVDGGLKNIYNKSAGLPDNSVNHVFEDRQGNLWLALNKGIAKIEYASPISIYDDRSGLTGLVLSVIKHHNDLYVGTTDGLFSLTPLSPKFRSIFERSGKCWSLLSIDDFLLAATNQGIHSIKQDIIEKRVVKNPSYVLLQSKQDNKRVWVGTSGGLSSLYLYPESKNKNGQCKWVMEHHQFKGVTAEIRTIVEEENGNLWLGTLTKGVLNVDTSINGTVTLYYTSYGLPEGEVHVFWAAGHVMFAAPKEGIFRFNRNKKRFVPDLTLGKEFTDGSKGVFRIAEDKDNHIWIHSYDLKNFQAIPGPYNTFTIKTRPFHRIPLTQVDTIYPDPDGNITWFGSHDGLICFNKRVKKNYDHNFLTLIRDILINGNSLVFGDYKCKIEKDSKSNRIIPVITYADRNIRFDFAALFFEGESETQYRYFLQGYDASWSDWVGETKKDYTNLDPGFYTFRVQAKNIYEHQGYEDFFHFKILQPWYRTWWAFLSYALALFMLIYLVSRWWRSIQLEQEKQKLEKTVKDRTKELKEQSEKLKEMDKVKSRFFANISHEFRTPLTLIMSPLEQMLSDSQDNKQHKKLNLMLRNSQRLLSLINKLLELSKFESGTMKLEACQQNIIPFLKGIVASFDLVVTKNELDLAFQSDEEDITLYFDQGKLEEILFNLLSNAVKFTPLGGKITVKVTRVPIEEEDFPSGSVDIKVSDTGPGIPRDQLAHIFERFYQSDITYEHHLKGSGIGLSIAKELVELHHGTINVHSHEGKGTQFIIRLPLGDAHLGPEEIVESPAKPYKHKTVNEIPSLYIMEKEPEISAEVKGDESEGITKNNFDLLKPEKNIILVVEDNADFREYIKKSLEPLYMVVEAANGREGIQKAQEIIPDLVISDVMMPEVDGYELCRELKNNIMTCHIPIILLTAKASEESIIQGLETGADDYITKPFNTRILCARIKNLVDLRSHMQQTLKREMTQQPVKISISQNDKTFIKRLKEVIDQNISDPDFNVTQMCKELDLSQPTVYRKIYALTGESPTEFIRSHRLKRGAELLKKNDRMTVLEVALEVGFSSANYFTKCFKKMFHQLPSTYQASEASKQQVNKQ
ncbi:MAG: response regulator [Candidatus Aminicenantes bacterium]|nr:MAG: response regulator [Candidatus Aminicenantes bacterium]